MPTLAVYSTGPQEQALGTLRYGAAATASGWQITHGKEGVDTVYPERVHQADYVLIQRDFPRFFQAYRRVVAEAHSSGKPIIYDLDDLLLAIPAEHPNRRDYQDALGGMAYALTQADQVIVSTQMLHDALLPLQPRMSVWPTALPDDLWSIDPPRLANPNTTLTLGYMGGTSHAPDIDSFLPVLQRILQDREENVRILFWGCPPPAILAGHPQVQQVHTDVSDYAGFAEAFRVTASADIWLAPLGPDLFNRCKSAIKFWEYSAVGGVGVYSRLEPYEAMVREGENGLLAGSTDEWYAAINRLADDPELRLRLARNAQETLRKQGLLSNHIASWQAIYASAAARKGNSSSQTPLAETMARFSEAIQVRADERHGEVLELLDRNVREVLATSFWRSMERFRGLGRKE